MEMELVASDLKILAKNKLYLGAGVYKDTEGVVWRLEKAGNDWVIKRVGSKTAEVKQKVKPETAKEYWSKILTKEMLDVMFKGKVAVRAIKGFITSDEAKVSVNCKFNENWADVELVEDAATGSIITSVMASDVKDWVGKSKALSIPEKVNFAALSLEDKVGFFMAVAEADEFLTFVVSNILSLMEE